MDSALTSSNAAAEKGERSSEKTSAKQRLPFYRLFSFADTTDKLLMIVGVAGAAGTGVAQPLMTVLFGNLIESFGGTTDIHTVVHNVSKVALHFVFLAIGAGIVAFLQVSCWTATGERQAARIRISYLKAMLRQEIGFFDKENNTEEVVGRMSGDITLIQDAMGEKVGKFIQLISTFFAAFTIAFVRGWHLTLVLISIIPLLVAGGAAMSTVIDKMATHGQTAYTEAAVVVEQTIGSIRTVASFTGEEQSLKKYSESLRHTYKSSVQEGLAAGLGVGSMMLLMYCGYALGVWYGSKLILSRGYTGARVINVIVSILIGSSSLGQTSPCIGAFAAGQAAAFKMFETIYRKPEIDDACDCVGQKLDDIRGDIEFRDVYFSYPARPDKEIFSGFSLLIQSGLTMALVGESGSGKSTAISLIERFYDPQAGEVLIDGINLKKYQLRWIRGKIGLVSQEPVLFASSIKDNIAYGKDDATIEEIRVAAELANAANFIERMPQGIDTMVGEHGTQLSGGQKQRIAIARAILRDPRILLLDEATSALDVESESIVQEALDRVMTNRTTIVVAHRLSTIRNATTISVISRGVILEKGSHSELLMDPNGAYSKMISMQEMKKCGSHTSQPRIESSDSLDLMGQESSRHTANYTVSQGPFGKSSNNSSFKVSSGSHMGLDSQKNSSEKAADTEVPPQGPKVSLRRLAYHNKPELLVYILGSTAAILNGVINPILGLLMSDVINTFYQPPPKLKKDSRYWSLMFVMLGVMSLIAVTVRAYFFAIAGAKLIRRIRLMTFKKVVYMEIGWFDDIKNSSGLIGARLSADAATVRRLVGDTLALALQNTATLIAGLVIAFSTNWLLSLITLAMVPLIGINFWIQMKFMKGSSANAKMMYEEACQVANSAVGNMRTIASFSAEDKVLELYKMKCEGPRRVGLRKGVIGSIGYGVSFFLLYCVNAASYYVAARLLQDGKTTFNEVFRVYLGLSMAVVGISSSSSLALDSTKANSATASVFAILDRTSKINPNEDSGMTLEGLNGNIEFQNVSFSYPTRPDVQIFRDFCLAIQCRKTVALVGESGSGKSTVISLLQRFYDPDSGHILVDGTEIQKFQLKWLRQQMGVVSQEPTLFNDTIRGNIGYGKEGRATEAEIIAAAELANAHKFISSLQQGYDTLVGERGIQLSGGQKQRVAIARAMVKDPKILLLDEATSALDAESEKMVQDALNNLVMNQTTVVVAHRLSTIRAADLIVVIKNGVIIEKGDHETLSNLMDGAYASLISHYSRNSS